MAYKLAADGKTVIREAYGIYGNTIYGTIARNLEGGAFGGSVTYFNSITNGVALLSFPKPFVPEAGQVAGFASSSAFNPHLHVVPAAMERYPRAANRQRGAIGCVRGIARGKSALRTKHQPTLS